RTKVFSQVKDWNYFFTDEFDIDPKNFEKHYKKPEIRAALKVVADRLSSENEFTAELIHSVIEDTGASFGMPGKLFQPIRLAVSGMAGGAELDATMLLIGRNRCIKNIERAIKLAEQKFS